MDQTTLLLAVDSTQVNSASAALDKMAASGGKAEGATTLLTNASATQAKVLAGQLAPAAGKASSAVEGLAEAGKQIGSGGAAGIKSATAALASEAVQAGRAKTAVQGVAAATAEIDSRSLGAANTAAATLANTAARTAASLAALEAAGTSLGAAPFERATSSLKAESVAALEAARSVIQLREAEARSGSLATATTSPGAGGAGQVSDAAAINALASAAAKADAQAGALGKTLARDTAAGAAKAEASILDLSKATTSLGAAASVDFSKVTTSLGATAGEAQRATTEVNTLRKALSLVSGSELAGATTSLGAAPRPAQQAASPVPASAAANVSALAAAAKPAAQQTGELAKASKLAAFQQQQLGFQVHDFVVQVASGQSPLTAFVQQGSQLAGTFGGARNALSAVLGLLTPMRVAIGGAAGALAALAVGFVKGSEQSKAFADAITLTGNAAGLTEGRFNATARAIAASSQISIASAREFSQALVSSGEIGPQVFASAAEAAARYGEATGQTADEVAKDFAGMSRDVVRWTLEHNRSMHLVSLAQFEQIKALAESGRGVEAQAIVYEALNQRLRTLDGNMGTLQRVLRETSNVWRSFWDSVLDVGRTETIEEKLAKVRQQVAQAQPAGEEDLSRPSFRVSGAGRRQGSQPAAQAQEQSNELSRQVLRQQENASAEAFRSQDRAAAIAANEAVDATLKRAKAQSVLNDALAKGRQQLAAINAEREREGRQPLSAADQKAFLDQIRKENTPQKTGNNEAGQVLRANLQRDLQAIDAALEQERDDFGAHNRLMQGELQAGNVSVAQFYADRRASIEASVAAEIAALEKESARLKEFKAATKDPSEQIQAQTRIDEIDTQQARLRRQASNEVAQANQEQAASFKALGERVTEYRAQLLQLQGDEVGAARLRAQAAIESARVLASQAQNTLTPGDFTRFERGGQLPAPAGQPIDVAAQQTALDQQNTLLEVKTKTSLINERLQIEEERIALAQRNGALSENAALIAQGDARRKAVEELEKVVAAQEEVAKTRPQDYTLQIDTSRARLELERLKAELDPLKEKFDNLFKDASSNAFERLLNGDFAKTDQSKLSQKLSDINSEFDRREQRIRDNGGSLSQINRNERDRKAAEDRARKDAQPTALDQFKETGKAFGAQIAAAFNAETAKGLSDSLFGKGGLFEGAGGLAASVFGGKKPEATAADAVAGSFTSLQTVGIDPTTSALQRLQLAADAAAGSLSTPAGAGDLGINAAGAGFSAAKDTGLSSEQSVANLFADADKAQAETARKTDALGQSTATAALDMVRLSQSAQQGGNALALLPRIISLIEAAAASSSASSASGGSGGGLGGFIASLFGGGSGGSSGSGLEGMSADDLVGFYHSGGIVGQTRDMRPVAPGVFAGAAKFHEGGMVSGRPAPSLATNEVAAILMGGPPGTREEVLHASDPRHSDNLSPVLRAVIEAGQTGEASVLALLAGNAGLPGAPGLPGAAAGPGAAGGVGGPGGHAFALPAAHRLERLTESVKGFRETAEFRDSRDSSLRSETLREVAGPAPARSVLARAIDRVSSTSSSVLRSIQTATNAVVSTVVLPAGETGAHGVVGAAIAGLAAAAGPGLAGSAGAAAPGLTGAAGAAGSAGAAGAAGGAGIGLGGASGAAGMGGAGGSAGAAGAGGLGGAAGAAGAAASFHLGGLVGQPGAMQPAVASMFTDARKYHTGGTVLGGQQIPGLSYGEVPAILMGGPKGVREEVLTADDPRHRDNIAPALFQRLRNGSTVLDAIAKQAIGEKADAGLSALGATARQPSPVAAMLHHDKQAQQLSPLTRFMIGSPETVQSIIHELAQEADFEGVTALRGLHVAGGRELGGPVSAGSSYQVLERGKPEMLEVGGKNYLLMGSQGGQVKPAGGGTTQLHVTNHFSIKGPIDRRSEAQISAAVLRSGQALTSRIR